MEEALNYIRNIIKDVNVKLSEIHGIWRLDPCDALLTPQSYERFCGDIQRDYATLIRDLDQDSITTINRILTRLRYYWEDKATFMCFTESEAAAYRKIMDHHFSQTVRLAPDCYAYGPYLLPAQLITTSVLYYEHFLHEIDDSARMRAGCVIDAGGGIGDSALILSRYTDSDVHVFEPASPMMRLIEKTVLYNKLTRIVLNPLALGATDEMRAIHLADDSSTICAPPHVEKGSGASEQIRVITLDSYVKDKGLRVGLIKADVEGFEQQLLQGAKETICAQKPVLLISMYHSADDFFGIKPLIESWNLGYRFKIRKPADRSIIVDTTLIAEAVD